jgi:8-oxo-dGTP diphosphatase
VNTHLFAYHLTGILKLSTMKPSAKPLLQVAAKAAIVDSLGRVLIVREASTGKNNTKVGKWGLVGGRIEPSESFLDGLRREVDEETGLRVKVLKPLYVGEWRPTIHDVPHQIIAIFMYCLASTSEVKLSVEHDEYAWIEPAKRHVYPMMEPDCYVVDALASS